MISKTRRIKIHKNSKENQINTRTQKSTLKTFTKYTTKKKYNSFGNAQRKSIHLISHDMKIYFTGDEKNTKSLLGKTLRLECESKKFYFLVYFPNININKNFVHTYVRKSNEQEKILFFFTQFSTFVQCFCEYFLQM